MNDFTNDVSWLLGQVENLKDHHEVMTVSKYAESNRYLPSSVTPMAGYYSFEVTPYIKEIVDCMSLSSPVRKVSVQKGVQVGMTVGLLENALLYCVGHVKTCPIMLLTADAEIANLRIEQYVMPMLQHSGMRHLIQSNDAEAGGRKTGKTKDKISFEGGGFMLPFGANNAAKLRSFSIQFLMIDECDGFKASVGKDGDPVKLAIDRTSAYDQNKKICILSTPTIKGASKVEDQYLLGDQRRYYVPCKHCDFPQIIEWNKVNKDTGEIYGLTFNHDNGVLDYKSIRYICKNCGGEHRNADKRKMLARGHWEPTATPKEPGVRSYHISGLYSPVGFKSWESVVVEWFECWDVVRNQSRDVAKLQVFYNNNLGETFRKENDKLKVSAMHAHRRTEYRMGEVPNQLARRSCEGNIVLLTCAVDVHKNKLNVAVFGWTKSHRAFLVDYQVLVGNCETIESQTWCDLRDLVHKKVYKDEDGRSYLVQLALVDSGYLQNVVLEFCAQTDAFVPIKGIPDAQKSATFVEFKMSGTKMGINAFNVNVNFYKDRWYGSLKRPWDESGMQPEYCFNAPVDATEKQLKELTMETRVEDINPVTGHLRGFKWHRPSGADNELWDLLVYNNAAIDIMAWDLFVRQGERESVNWLEFWHYAETGNRGKPVFYSE